MDFEPLIIRNARGNCLARPALCLFLYSDKPVHDLAPFAADAIELYLQCVSADTMVTFIGNNGELRSFTPRRLASDLRRLRNFPVSMGAAWIEYDSDPDGWAGEYGVFLYASDFKRYEHELRRDNLLRLDFPAAFWRHHGLDTVVDLIARLANAFPFESGNAGYAFKRTSGTAGSATKQINRLLPRFMSFDPCYQGIQDFIRGRTLGAHWINLLNDPLSEALGGFDSIAQRLGGVDVRRIDHGMFIRGSEEPPIGDSNRRAPDIGLLPNVARVLKPKRADVTGLGEPHFDVRQWLARFDEMESRPWNNST
jgi:hypothetical protein